ncbi:MAG: hypothetical protein K9N29_06740 [Candidatus Marinimicrobia bacterium]|nr:hypothetical protein [Candidatus Neomarinimicrobiota bacterium]
MHFIKSLLLVFISIVLTSCNNTSTEPKDVFTVEGTIYYESDKFENALVKLGNQSTLSTTTDVNGFFKISDVPAGTYTLNASKVFEDGTFSERADEINVNDDIIIDALKLPRAVFLFESTNTTATSTELSWSSTDALDFREYKLFRHSSSGLDESTGELIHISTTIADTIFTDDRLYPLTEYFYRVYVMNEYGRLGGSNIISTATQALNLFPDGGFESSASFSDHWDMYSGQASVAEISDSIAYEGLQSLHLSLPAYISHDFMGGVEAGEIYKISFWYRAIGDSIAYGQPDDRSFGLSNADGASLFFDMFRTMMNTAQDGSFDSGWLFYSSEMVIQSNLPVYLYLGLGSSTDLHMWFDNFSLVKIIL